MPRTWSPCSAEAVTIREVGQLASVPAAYQRIVAQSEELAEPALARCGWTRIADRAARAATTTFLPESA